MSAQVDIDITSIHGRCGILVVRMSDPFSQILDIITDLNFHAVGFYYEDVNKHNVILFNTFDNRSVVWLKMGCSMYRLCRCSHVQSINFYPLRTYELKFRQIIVDTINANAKSIPDPSIIYTSLLYKIMGLEHDHTIITGYTIVNRVISLLSEIESLGDSSSQIIPNPFLSDVRTVNIAPIWSDMDAARVIEESKGELLRFSDIFVRTIVSDKTFRDLFTQKYKHNINLKHLFRIEETLIHTLTTGINRGELNINLINHGINDLSNIRLQLDSSRILPKIDTKFEHIHIDTTSYPSLIKPYDYISDMNALEDLKRQIELWITSPTPIINLDTIIMIYNRIIRETKIKPLDLPSRDMNSSSRDLDVVNESGQATTKQAIIVLPGDSYIHYKNEYEDIIIPTHGANLSNMRKKHLMDVLIYVESLRNADGMSDSRYASIQNAITYELAQRNRRR